MQLLMDGLKLMVTGMGMVFIFLCIMILLIYVSSKLSTRFKHLFPVEEAAGPASGRRRQRVAGTAENQNQLVAVVTAAIQMYKQDKHR
ncbi:MAG: OadG family transporter subunit [Lentisphaeria bacterium]